MGHLVRNHDWAARPLGPVETWPRPLGTILGMVLGAIPPMAICWGPDCVLIYNDAWRVLIGDKHPAALGRPAREVFPDIWGAVSSIVLGVMAGHGGAETHGGLLPSELNGRAEEVWLHCSFNPILLEDGTVGGTLALATEVTARFEVERTRRAGEARQAFLLTLSDAMRDLSDPREMMALAAAMLGAHLSVDRVGYAELDPTGDFFSIGRDWCAPGKPSLVGRHRLDAFGLAAVADLRAGRTVVFDDTLAVSSVPGAGVAGAYRVAGGRGG